jgi:hypothetical protein
MVGDLFRERRTLGLVLCLEFRTLTREVGLFGIRLRTNRHILASGH